MELLRIKQMYAYFPDDGHWEGPTWQSRALMFKPLIEKPPWMAAWDRIMRLLVRCDSRGGDIFGDSYVEDIYDEYAGGNEFMNEENFELFFKEYGFSRCVHAARMDGSGDGRVHAGMCVGVGAECTRGWPLYRCDVCMCLFGWVVHIHMRERQSGPISGRYVDTLPEAGVHVSVASVAFLSNPWPP